MNPPYLGTFLRLYRHLHWPEDRLQAYQKEQLVKILKWSAEQVSFYRQRFREYGLEPSGISGPAGLARLPLTERIDLQQQPESFLADNMNPGKCNIYATSGSTGEPVKVWFSQKEEAVRGALSVRNRLVAGVSPFGRILSFGGSIANRTVSLYQRLGIYPILRLPACSPQIEALQAYWGYRPRILTGYASAIQHLGETLQRSGNAFPKPGIVMPVGEMLTTNTRRSLQETFQAPVRDLYGTEELGYLAWECSRGGGYHLNADCFYFEVLQDGRPAPANTEGELVVTSLYMKTMPLIRYRLGDRVVLDPEPCSCGCAFPRLKSIQGRLDDFLVLPGGEKVHAVLAVYAFKALKEVRRFQVIQEEDGGFQIHLSACPMLNSEQIKGIQDYFRTHFQTDDVRINQADEIPVDPSVKWRPVVCRKRLS